MIFHIKTTSPKIRENDLERLHNYIGKLVKTTGCAEIKAGGVGQEKGHALSQAHRLGCQYTTAT